MAPHFDPGGKAHRALKLLAAAPATLATMRRHVIGQAPSANKRRKFFHVVGALLDDGAVEKDGEHYELTAGGQDLLKVLEAARPTEAIVGAPNARLFTQQEAA